MKHARLLLLFSACLLFSCSGDKPAKVSSKKGKKLEYALQPENIYRHAAIDTAINHASNLQKNESRRLFMSGLDLLVNKNNADASVEYFKEAIYYYPDEKSYQYLFQAYIKLGNAVLADSVNTALSGRMDYGENSFNDALVAALRKDTVSCLESLDYATMEGFVFKERIVNEPLFDFLKENRTYQGFLVINFGDDVLLRKRLFSVFVKSFPDLALPFEMNPDSAQSFNVDQDIDYDFAGFIPGMSEGRFARDVSKEYMYVGRFNLENGVALLYKTFEVFADTLNPVYTNLLIYDTLGTLQSNMQLACFCSPLESKGGLIGKDFQVEVKSYKTNWEFDPLEKGYAGNRIVSRDETERFEYKLTGNQLVVQDKTAQVASSGQ